MILRYTASPKLHAYSLPSFTVIKKVADEKQARKLMKAIIKAKGDAVSNFKLYDPIVNEFIQL